MPKSVMPIVHSILDAQALGPAIAKHFELEGVHCELLTRGMNDVYLVRANGVKYAARVWRSNWRSENDVRYELEFLGHLKARGIAVPGPHPSPGERDYFVVEAPEGARCVALFEWIDGKAYGGRPDPALAPAVGAAVAEMHLAARDFAATVGRPIHRAESFGSALPAVERLAAHRPDDVALYRKVRDGIRGALAAIGEDDVAIGPTHGDMHAFNVFIGLGGDITLLDFDGCGHGYWAHELVSFCWAAEKSQLGQPVIDGYLAGYESVRPLGGRERELLPLFLAAKEFGYLCGFAANVDAIGHVAFRWPGLDWFAQSVQRNAAAAGLI